jgi:membrane-bound acyltransferase YfiQ involved in biofilm formation
VLGLYAGKHYDTVRNALKQHTASVFAMIIPILLYGIGAWVQYTRGLYLFDGNVLKMVSDCMTICVMLTLCMIIDDRAPAVITKPLSFIYAASFAVYLSHCLFLQHITSVISQYSITDIGHSWYCVR